jgi:hypothetical protein
MVIRTRKQWRGAIRSALVAVQATINRLLVWDGKASAAGSAIFSYTERQMLQAVLAIIAAKLAAVVQVL